MAEITDDIRERVKKIVCDILEVEPAELTETTVFTEEFGADSLAVIEILTALEDTLDVSIDQAEAPRMVSLAGIYDVLAEA
ncbi:acyl carrier protein [Streptomyces diastatochromogenes]|uniref:acyl carrier protein n=1 Tax=Streptomyces diastatochromogenes TaxID=42236 RepID=UPI00367DA17C